jgi:hypothetical protein
VDLLKEFSYWFSEKEAETCNSLLQYPARHLHSQNINATSPSKTQRVTHTFSAVQQDCLTLTMEAAQPFESSGTASQPIRTKKSATLLTEPEITQQIFLLSVSLNFPIQLSLVPLTNCQRYSHCNCLQYPFVINLYCMNCFSLKFENVLKVAAHLISL